MQAFEIEFQLCIRKRKETKNSWKYTRYLKLNVALYLMVMTKNYYTTDSSVAFILIFEQSTKNEF